MTSRGFSDLFVSDAMKLFTNIIFMSFSVLNIPARMRSPFQISRRSPQFVYGRNDFNIKVIVPRSVVPLVATQGQSSAITLKPGDYCVVKASDILRIHRFPSKNCIFGQRYSTYQHQAHNPEITSIRLSLLCIHHASPLVNSYCKNRRSCV